MILESAILDVKPGESAAFEAAFAEARAIIAGSDGCLSYDLRRCMEKSGRYLLLVRWRSLEDHTKGFRGSAAYQDWRRLLHHFYDPMPTVEHYEALGSASDRLPTVEFFFSRRVATRISRQARWKTSRTRRVPGRLAAGPRTDPPRASRYRPVRRYTGLGPIRLGVSAA